MPVTLWSDVGCPWATVFTIRWRDACERAGIPFELDHRCFPLELINERPTPKLTLDAEIPVVGALEPDFGFRLWTEPEWTYPVTTLPALEAVQAAKEQGLAASAALDLCLREALFADGRCISNHSVVLDVARRSHDVDVEHLEEALVTGRCRHRVFDDWREAVADDAVQGSPTVVLPGGRVLHNPGIELHWEGKAGEGGFPVVDGDDRDVYDELISAVAGSS